MSINRLWVEKHRPSGINEFVFHDSTQEKQIRSMVANQEIPNLLFYGVQGSGKTALSKILISELGIDEMDILNINASDENNVDTIREKVKTFTEGYSMGSFKVIQLEEMDYLTINAQAVLRQIMEEASDTCRFICTCNYENKIIPALRSRLQSYYFKSPDMTDVSVYAGSVLVKEDIEFDIPTLEKYISAAYPDIRKIVNLLQQYSIDGKLLPPNVEETGDYKFKMLDLIEKDDFKSLRKLVSESVSREEYEDVYKFMYQNITKVPKFASDTDRADQAIIVIADYLYRHSLVSDPEINAAAMFIKLGTV